MCGLEANVAPVTFNVSFQLFSDGHFPCSENSSPFHYLLTSLTQKGIALFRLLIIIIFPFFLHAGHFAAQGHFPVFEKRF